MSVEVLMSCMFQKDFAIVEKSRIKSDAIIINQTNENGIEEKEYDFGTVKMISTTERGLSRSRNMALKNATADLCILCDDDEVLVDNYVQMVEEAYNRTNADVLVFNVKSMNTNLRPQEKLFDKIKKIKNYKSYSSVHVTFRRKVVLDNNLKFNTYFGSGSGYYLMSEDSLFFAELHRCTDRILSYPAILAELYTGESTWFKGFNKKYFYDMGAFVYAWKPHIAHLLKWYYVFKLYKNTELNVIQMIKQLNCGIKEYKQVNCYKE